MKQFAAENCVKKHILPLVEGKLTTSQIPTLSSFSKELLSGICRHWLCLNHILDLSMKKKTTHKNLRLLLLIGIYRLYHQPSSDPKTIIKTCMKLAEIWGLSHNKPLIYGVLNRQLKTPYNTDEFSDEIKYSLPSWLYTKICSVFKHNASVVLKAQLRRPDYWIQVFNSSGITEEMQIPDNNYPLAAKFNKPDHITAKQGYDDGAWQITDLSTQIMLNYLPETLTTIVDACSAPGGKAIGVAKKHPRAVVEAVEIELKRIPKMEENIQRMGLKNINIIPGDFLTYSKKNVDLVWVDAPCSGTGVLKKHPEIKYRLSIDKIEQYQEQQLKLLEHAYLCVKNHGTIFYSTCSILDEENDDVIALFIKNHPKTKILSPQKSDYSESRLYGELFLIDQTNGGYLSRLEIDK
tara:strand:+ start:12678 stop:13898 length:1221 start_codon:yes stop_codon:yes gene_type:complete